MKTRIGIRMSVREWTDPRQDRRWTVSFVGGRRPVVAFGSGREIHTVVADFSAGLHECSDEDLQRLLDEGTRRESRGESARERGGSAREYEITAPADPPSESPDPVDTETRESVVRSQKPLVLIVEDDPGHAALIKAAFAKHVAQAQLHFVQGGWEAQAYLTRQSPHHDWRRCPPPSLVVLDLGLPDITGLEIIEWMAEWEWLAKIPVIVFTASDDPDDERRAYELGVHRYMRKPEDYGKLAVAVREELESSEVIGKGAVAGDGGLEDGGLEDGGLEDGGLEREDLPAHRGRANRLGGLPLLSLNLLGMTAVVAVYEATRYVFSTGRVAFPMYVMTASYIVIAALVVAHLVSGAQRRRRGVEIQNQNLILALQRSLKEVETHRRQSNSTVARRSPRGAASSSVATAITGE